MKNNFASFVNSPSKNFPINTKFIRFLFVGLLNTLVGYAFFAFFIYLGLGDILAPLFATFFGVLFNFKSYGYLVFKNTDNRLIFKFIAVYIVVYICNVLGLILLAKAGVENRYLSGFILIMPLALLAYYLNNRYVFCEVKNEIKKRFYQ